MELKFKILVLRVLMMILYKLAFPGKGKEDNRDIDKLSMEVHTFIRTMDEFSRAPAPVAQPVAQPVEGPIAPDRPFPPAAGKVVSVHVQAPQGDREPLRMKVPA